MQKVKLIFLDFLKEKKVLFLVLSLATFVVQAGNEGNGVSKNPPDQQTITGTVITAKDQMPLPGVTVLVKGTKNGVVTDFDGKYSIDVAGANATLEFSYVGFKTQAIKIAGKTKIDVQLKEDLSTLDEVVVVGYGTQKKSDLTGAVVSLSEDDMNNVNATSVDEMLQGRASGVQVTQSSHAPGGGSSIRIRGTGSINAGNEPLYVIDGLPIDNRVTANGKGSTTFDGALPASNPLNTIAPSDIKSVEILKDASATAIYGSRGANGVILITTKTGKKGKFAVDYDTSLGVSTIANKLDVLNTSEYIKVMNELSVARGGQPVFSSDYIASVGKGTDWQDQIFRTALTNRQNISISGSSEKTSFYSSLNYTNQKGIVLSSDYKRYQGRINLKHEANKKFSYGMNFNTSLELNNSVPVNGFGINQDADAINSALNTPPVFSVFNADGSYYRPESGQVVSVTLDNPLAIIRGQNAKDKVNRTIARVYGNYSFLPELVGKVSIGTDRSYKRRDVYINRIAQQGQSVGGNASILNGELSNTLVEGTLTFDKVFNKDHSFKALIGSTYQKFEQRNSSAGTRGFASDITGTDNLGLGDRDFNSVGSFSSTRVLISYLSRINYSFKNKYLFTGSIRADGSSNFGKNNKYGYFPSFSGAWKISEENFLKNNRKINTLKLRIGWGQIGNDDIGLGKALSTYVGAGNVVINDQLLTAISPARIPNPDLKWETSEQTNIGLDFGFFNNRLTGSLDYFKKTTKDLLLNLPIPSSSGFATITRNVGQVDNSGLEVMLSSHNLTGEFTWNTSVNFSTLKNSVDNLGPLSEIVRSGDPTTLIRPGEPLFAYYGLQDQGIFQTKEEVANSAQSDLAKPGVPKWKDVNKDGVINDEDRVVLGDPYPDFTFGFSNDFHYKDFALSVFFEGSFGSDLFHWQTVDALYANDPYRNRLAKPLLNRWTPENHTNKYPSGINQTLYQGNKTNSFTVLDASYVRLKNIKFSYQIPVNNITALKSAQVYIAGQNLAIVTDYPGFDPDVNSSGRGNVRQDRNAYPSSRTFVLGFKLSL